MTAVFALALPAGYEALNSADGMPENHPEAWEKIEFAAVLSYVENLPAAVINRISSLSTHYRPGSQGRNRLWTNHCDQCQKAIDEEWLHEDLDGPFGLVVDDVSAAIQLHQLFEPFEALVGIQAHGVEG